MKKRNKIIIGIILLVLLGGGVVLFKFIQNQQKSLISPPTKNEEKSPKDQPVDNPNTDNPKKILAQQIKEDLQKDLEKIKKGEKNENGNYVCSWLKTLGEGCGMYRGNEWRLNYFGSENNKWKEKQHPGAREGIYVFPEELETDDWQEIENLIQQIEKLGEEKKNQENQNTREEQAKIDQKLNSNPKMFLYKDVWEWWENDPRDYDRCHVFRGMENGQEFFLVFPENHPAIANLPNDKEFPNQKQKETLVLIEGVENIPLQSNGKVDSWKKVNLSDKIAITLSSS